MVMSPRSGLRAPCTAAGSFYEAFFHWNHACSTKPANTLRPNTRARLTVAHAHSSHQRHASSIATAADEAGTAVPRPIQRQASDLRKHTSNINTHADLSSHMRHLMRKIPHSVVVITAAAASASAPTTTGEGIITPESSHIAEDTFRGMTVSSFNTVTLDPKPLVSFNARIPSATHSAMLSSGTFLAHFLLSSSAGARIADAFAKGGNQHGEVFRRLAAVGGPRAREVHVFVGKGTDGAPLIAGDGVLQVLRCKLMEGKEVVVGDHRVVVAEVVGILAKPGRKKDAAAGGGNGDDVGMGVVYGDQRYWSLGRSIDLEGGGLIGPSGDGGQVPVRQTIGLNVRRGDERGR